MASKPLVYRDLGHFAQGGVAELRKIALADGTTAILRQLQSSKLLRFGLRSRFMAGTVFRYSLSPHPNIVNSFERGTHLLRPYEIIEFINGVSLRSLFNTKSPVLKNNTYGILMQMAQGLAWVHEHGIMHLDVKPENFLITASASLLNVKLTDFDLSRDAKDYGPRRQMGTPGYMAPEQFVDKCSYQASDVFAFGLIAYQLLTGKVAFTGNSEHAMWRHQASSRITAKPLHEYTPTITPPIENVIMKCLAKSLNDRYRNMTEVVRALGPAIR
jgi:eukaryotic-like serine/threonine-protein kinase